MVQTFLDTGRLNPRAERRTPGNTCRGIVDVFYIFRSVKALDFKIGDSAKSRKTLGFRGGSPPNLCPPLLFLFDLSKFVLAEHESSRFNCDADRKLQLKTFSNLKS